MVSGDAAEVSGLETAEPSSLGPICFTISGGPVCCCFESAELVSFMQFLYGALLYMLQTLLDEAIQ